MIKCVIWDLDNTVFDGVISEDEALEVRAGMAELLGRLSHHGIISSIASRNDEVIALGALERVGLRSHFVYPQICWSQKSTSVAKILGDLHFRPHDVLFVDDREFERDEVRSRFPDMACDDGSDIATLASRLQLNGLAEDGPARFRMYQQEEERLTARQGFDGSDADFLATCGIVMEVRGAETADLPRIEELLGRTNQLNSNKLDLKAAELSGILADRETSVLVATISDRYGSYGLSAVAICAEGVSGELQVLTLIVSCRLMGKGVAQALLALICQGAVRDGRPRVACRYAATDFNRQMHLLFTMNGFTRQGHEAGAPYVRELRDGAPAIPAWIGLPMIQGLDLRANGRIEPAEACVF